MRADGRKEQGTSRARWGRRRAGAGGGRAALRTTAEIQHQYEAARAFAGEVTGMAPTSHQYTAGQAAALAWLLEAGPAPLTYEVAAAAEAPSPEAVRRLGDRARALMDGAGGEDLFPRAYVMGVDYVCHWVQGHTDLAPIPGPE